MKKIIYTGIFIDKLPDGITADYNNIPALLHITDKFKPLEKDLRTELLGKRVRIEILGIGNNNRNQVLLTRDDILGYKHITVSYKDDSTPKESKNITKWDKFKEPIIIYGTYGYFNGKGVCYK